MKNRYLNFTAPKVVEIAESEIDVNEFTPRTVAGHTVYSMISSGTEINASYLDVFNWGFPHRSGYTAIFEVEYDMQPGDVSLCNKGHSHGFLATEDSILVVVG